MSVHCDVWLPELVKQHRL